MKAKTGINVFFLLLILGFVAHLDSPYSLINKNYAYSGDQPAVAQPEEIETPTNVPDLEDKLKSRKKEGHYIVETYQEYEVYHDKNGQVTKKTPTSKTETLKYWDYNIK